MILGKNDFSNTFDTKSRFNDVISFLDVSHARTMESMIFDCYNFNQNNSNIGVSNVSIMFQIGKTMDFSTNSYYELRQNVLC